MNTPSCASAAGCYGVPVPGQQDACHSLGKNMDAQQEHGEAVGRFSALHGKGAGRLGITAGDMRL